MAKKANNWVSSVLEEIRETLFTPDPEDSNLKKRQKAVGWYMFLILMICGVAAMLVAVSFAH